MNSGGNEDESTVSALTRATVISNTRAAEGLFILKARVFGWMTGNPAPGQFLMLRISDGDDPLLSRPFGISGFHMGEDGPEIELIYRTVGRGTTAMAAWVPGREVRFLGPLGHGFPLPPEGSRSILIAGGVGLPPLLALARRMAELGREGEVTLFYGEANAGRMMDLGEGKDLQVRLHTCTEDGSGGLKGLVTDLLISLGDLEGAHLYVCGPNPMMSAVHRLAEGKCLTSHYSLESRMACGFGVCMGCAVEVSAGDRAEYVRVCREGPVFPGEILVEESFPERV
ncbi:MAG TPA: dihydroorotate dehydrogenase electron transfer subunit [Proteobacteria bacterium]|nr:dihydroorotate dehydrogenase B (NAD(+)), electron transfer subunit [bacterium BMS3Abin14]HDL52393.1 dihydroorotate dehydrogenase electron transfer subunit [Pseudomonadota bacterium]